MDSIWKQPWWMQNPSHLNPVVQKLNAAMIYWSSRQSKRDYLSIGDKMNMPGNERYQAPKFLPFGFSEQCESREGVSDFIARDSQLIQHTPIASVPGLPEWNKNVVGIIGQEAGVERAKSAVKHCSRQSWFTAERSVYFMRPMVVFLKACRFCGDCWCHTLGPIMSANWWPDISSRLRHVTDLNQCVCRTCNILE